MMKHTYEQIKEMAQIMSDNVDGEEYERMLVSVAKDLGFREAARQCSELEFALEDALKQIDFLKNRNNK
jgi:hypothetical protein